MKGQRRGGSSPPPWTHSYHSTILHNTGAQHQETQSKRVRNLSNPLLSPEGFPPGDWFMCNTVRGVAHYCWSQLSLCLFCVAFRRIQLTSWANKRECTYFYVKKKKNTNLLKWKIHTWHKNKMLCLGGFTWTLSQWMGLQKFCLKSGGVFIHLKPMDTFL